MILTYTMSNLIDVSSTIWKDIGHVKTSSGYWTIDFMNGEREFYNVT